MLYAIAQIIWHFTQILFFEISLSYYYNVIKICQTEMHHKSLVNNCKCHIDRLNLCYKILPHRQIKSTVRLFCRRIKNRRRQIQTFNLNDN